MLNDCAPTNALTGAMPDNSLARGRTLPVSLSKYNTYLIPFVDY
ncbi:hypothetical protein LA5095_00997 [Roseibium album]|uniref:Uncharacterized protein n=1 Tax=Roseibium album TaxID=311410 RepID=A0A0M6ZDK1_9HYPH|nr:hypothetical protein [Labrenzia sp. EL_162]MBG6197528.1 hypothetical protein [Labrenzia sp. EL_159]MBG6201124.1 hypothetical protein [Labrenzia sp. EL_13]MBG6210673.1 hypothetical protein [Labrenzia sp. EL_126]CTQ60202.1 hypothetical protein LA5094_02974 [Roseibium album]